jgi:hypothetical protein
MGEPSAARPVWTAWTAGVVPDAARALEDKSRPRAEGATDEPSVQDEGNDEGNIAL